jgi:hypothetical protein
MNDMSLDPCTAAAQRLQAAIEAAPASVSVPLCAAVLDYMGAGMPAAETYFSDLRADAAYSAGIATPHELREYIGAYCRELADRGPALIVPEGARKRLLVDLWNTLAPDDKARFLQSVDPDGEFRKSA